MAAKGIETIVYGVEDVALYTTIALSRPRGRS